MKKASKIGDIVDSIPQKKKSNKKKSRKKKAKWETKVLKPRQADKVKSEDENN